MEDSVLDALPAGIRAVLATHDVGAGIEELVNARPGDVVLLTGSYARGEARAGSDLDLLVLASRVRATNPDNALCFPSILGQSIDHEHGGLHLNIEQVSHERIADLARIVGHGTGEHACLPNLQAHELRLVDRLHTGVVLRGRAEAQTLRRMVDLGQVRTAAAALAFLGTLSLLEKSIGSRGPAGAVLRRTAAESLLTAGVCAFDRLAYDVTHLVRVASALADRPGLPSLFIRYEHLLFADRLPGGTATDTILDLAVELYETLREPHPLHGVRTMLAPFRSHWTWSGREFQ